MLNFKKYNNIFGWLTFLIAAITYTLTLERAGSYWDCGEFISAAYKLQVVHPPGAPLFLLIERLFTLLAFGDTSRVAFWGNFGSGICSAFTILFLFWSITYLAKKLMAPKDENLSSFQLITILGSGLVGGLAYTFSDSFWFSAVETEVYSMSSMFTALVFWAILKWENIADEKHSDRWIVFIAYLTGLSIGVHLLNLLVIPTMAFVYYFKRYQTSKKGIVYTTLISVGILGFIQFGIIPGVISMAAKFDLFAVNTLGLGFGTGIIAWFVILIGGTVYGVIYSLRKGKVILNTVLLAFSSIVIGYSSYTIIVIRAYADPNINMYQTNDVFNLLSYINREQYGETPLLKGQYFTARPVEEIEGATQWHKGDDKYISTGKKISYKWEEAQSSFFPRIWEGQEESHVNFYKSWLNYSPTKKKPDFFSDNLYFFFTYQVNHMYWRYFMWNFAGRQNDIKGDGNKTDGNWISGIKFIDEMRLGPQDNLPPSITENRANNKLYFLPFILGLIGISYQYTKSKKDTTIVGLLFFFTGLAIVIYLNQYPLQPRERDYAYVGSFYAFAIWIGLGVAGLVEWLKDKADKKLVAIGVTTVCIIAVPVLMAAEEWDDHDRSGKFTTRDFATDYLESCAPNAILFSYGDNDTYPLWYAQEVEGIRPDVRVVNLSLLGMDWYISQMKKPTQEGLGVPFTLSEDKYLTGTRDYIYFKDMNLQGYTDVKEVLDFVTSDNPEAMATFNNGKSTNILPTKNFVLEVDKNQVIKTNTLSGADTLGMVDQVLWTYPKNGMSKSELMVMDLIANNNWERPIYFTTTMPSQFFFGLRDYLQLEGLAYRFVPKKGIKMGQQYGNEGFINTSIMYNNFMNKFKWGNLNSPSIYVDPETSRMVASIISMVGQLAEALLNEGQNEKALAVLNKWMQEKPSQELPIEYLYYNFKISELFYRLGDKVNGAKMANYLGGRLVADLKYYSDFKSSAMKAHGQEIQQNLAILRQMGVFAEQYQDEATAKKLNTEASTYANKFGLSGF